MWIFGIYIIPTEEKVIDYFKNMMVFYKLELINRINGHKAKLYFGKTAIFWIVTFAIKTGLQVVNFHLRFVA